MTNQSSDTNGIIERIGADPDEPAITEPGLLPFIEAARAQTGPRLRIDAQAVTAAWNERRAQRRRAIGWALAAGLGALAIASVIGRGGSDERVRDREVAHAVDRDDATLPVERTTTAIGEDAAPMLASAVHVESTGDVAPAIVVTDPWSMQVGEGALRITVDDTATQPLEVALPDGALQITRAVVDVRVAAAASIVEVQWGSVVRIERDGTRRVLHPTPPPSTSDGPSAEQLAVLAEQRLAIGDRAGAIKHLSQLVRRHPRSAAARTGVIDLARLLGATGRIDEARCAYRLYLEREPKSGLKVEVERALTQLGEGPPCRGLRVAD